MTYQEQLLDPRWLNKREIILDRDGNQCQVCLSDKELHVHHKIYLTGRDAWDYLDEYLITLCGNCHALFHGVDRHSMKPWKPKDDMLVIAQRTRQSIAALSELDRIIATKELEAKLKSNG